jgi:hypothetical protein
MERDEIVQKIHDEVLRSYKNSSLSVNLYWQSGLEVNFFKPYGEKVQRVKKSLDSLQDPLKLKKKLPCLTNFVPCYECTGDPRALVFCGLREINSGVELTVGHMRDMLADIDEDVLLKFLNKLIKNNNRAYKRCKRLYKKGGPLGPGFGADEDYQQ